MIITSNSVQHDYTIPNLSIIGEVDGLYKVAYKATVYLNSSTSFDHSYETTIYEMQSSAGIGTTEIQTTMVGIATTVTENKTVRNFTYCDVNFSTDNLDPNSFTSWEDLEEDQVLQWCFTANPTLIAEIQSYNENIVLEEKDKILNPLKYYRDSPVTPWKKRADEESAINN